MSQSNYDTAKFFTKDLLVIEMRKTQILMNKCVYLGLSILNLSKTIMYEFWYNLVKPNNGENTKLCYTDTAIFIVIVHVKIVDIYKDIAENVETRFDTSHFKLDRTLLNGKNKKLMKDELGGQILKDFND